MKVYNNKTKTRQDLEEKMCRSVFQSGDSGYTPGDSGPEGPEYPGLYPEYLGKNTLETLVSKN